MIPIRRLRVLLGSLAGAILLLSAAPVAPATADVPLSIAVAGNHFVNGTGQTVRLLGVNRPGTEYACEEGTGYYSGPAEDAGDAAAIAAWHADAVRIPLNEDCWLGINGEPAFGTVAGYRQAVENYVSDLNADGMYAILDLHWSAPGTVVADGQRPMPDDNSVAFWTSVAGTFAADPAVLFDAFNEPYSDAGAGYPVSWSCWRDGGCTLPDAPQGTTPDPSQTYTAVGMQTLVDAIRATGADQPILLGGLSFADDLSGWQANAPTDPDGQLAASFHVYQPNACATSSCWDSTVAPVAAAVPVVIGEFDEHDCSEDFDNAVMDWADAHGVSYLAWGWYVLQPSCHSLYLITDWTGTPAPTNGVAVQAHLTALAAAGDGAPGGSSGGGGDGGSGGGTGPGATGGSGQGTGAGGDTAGTGTPQAAAGRPASPPAPRLRLFATTFANNTISLRLRSTQVSRGTVTAVSARSYALAGRAGHRRGRISLGSARFKLRAGRREVVSVRLSASGRRLLATVRSLRVSVTITLTGPAGDHALLRRTITVRLTAKPLRGP